MVSTTITIPTSPNANPNVWYVCHYLVTHIASVSVDENLWLVELIPLLCNPISAPYSNLNVNLIIYFLLLLPILPLLPSSPLHLRYLRIGAFSSDLTGLEPYLKPPPRTGTTTPPGKKSSTKSNKKNDKTMMAMNIVNGNGSTSPVGATPSSMEANGSLAAALALRGRHMRGLEALDRWLVNNDPMSH